ncbi:cell division protein FtsB [Candidatus Riesia pediculicola USDA]|uniref:Cell division protein FtsB n=1 Tax=Riesia pediculicola (strain USDA) TaxID=515618 RepID=D4G7L4_RIEPU|nr:cell division protein FtsB [Candidatus Riesia pediculicola USDA]
MKRDRSFNVLTYVLLFVFLKLQFSLWFGKNGVFKKNELKEEIFLMKFKNSF